MRTATLFLILLLLVLLVLLVPVSARAAVIMDAADRYIDEQAFDGFSAVRWKVDNRDGAEDLTDVQFDMVFHGGELAIYDTWRYDDAANPWFGSGMGVRRRTPDGMEYRCSFVYYTIGVWGPVFFVDPTPDDEPMWPPDNYDILSEVPAGFIWDWVFRLEGVELFSVAEGDLTSDQLSLTLYDADPTPQTAPEPLSLSLLALGGVALLRKRGEL